MHHDDHDHAHHDDPAAALTEHDLLVEDERPEAPAWDEPPPWDGPPPWARRRGRRWAPPPAVDAADDAEHRGSSRGGRGRRRGPRPGEGGPGAGPAGPGWDAGAGGWGGPGRGGPPGGPRWGRGHRRGRGEVRIAVLVLLAEGPMHGYQIIRELTERTGGRWRPSPGAVYPTLQLLEDEGLVRGEERDGKRVFTLTDDGQAEVERLRSARGHAPWARPDGGDDAVDQLRDAYLQLGAAARQIADAGTSRQQEAARALLTEARKGIYRLLAEDDEPADDEPGDESADG